jgi:subtilase family serine protease
MKAKWFGTFLVFVMVAVAVVPVMAAAPSVGVGVSTFIEKGPQAVPVDATASSAAGPTYGLFSCQVGLSTGQCYDPYQMRTAYGVDSLIASGYAGSGKTIVIVDAFQDANLITDLNYFINFYGLPSLNGLGSPNDPNLGTFTQVAPDGLGPVDDGWAGEITLDVEWAHAIAPGANITLVLSADNSDESILSALNYAIDHKLGDVISMSFGEADTCLGTDLTNAWHQAFVHATQKGITLFASSGDQGAVQPSCDGNSWIKATSSPASDPLVTSVGGTELHAADYCLASLGCDPSSNPAPGTYLSEIGWNEGDPYGDFGNVFGLGTIAGGGGFSTVWDEPAYQQGTINGGKQRGVSDVSYNGSILHGVLVRFYGGWYRFGGTSAGSPQWAALIAIADQVAGYNYGFINAALYKIGQGKQHYSNAFNDVTSGTNSALEFDANNNPVDITGFDAGTGWDAFTGLGSPKTASIVSQLPMHWSAGQGNAAISGSKPHTNGNPSKPGHMNSH